MRAGRAARPPVPLEPAEEMLAAISSAAATAGLLAAAAARADELAEQSRRRVRTSVDADAQRELAAGAALAGQLFRSARQHHDQAVRAALALVLTGEEQPCSSR